MSTGETELGFVPEAVPTERCLDDRLREIYRIVELAGVLSSLLAKEVRSPLARRLLQQITQDLERYQPELAAGLESVSVIENSKADVISATGLC